jgi:hypothetical protein
MFVRDWLRLAAGDQRSPVFPNRGETLPTAAVSVKAELLAA